MEKEEIQNRLEEFIDKVWGTSCFAETPFNNYTEEKRERDYDKAMEDMIGFIQQELDRAREEEFEKGVIKGRLEALPITIEEVNKARKGAKKEGIEEVINDLYELKEIEQNEEGVFSLGYVIRTIEKKLESLTNQKKVI